MANQEHLDILRQGVEVWNQWRSDNFFKTDISIDLCEVCLSEVNLSGIDFHKVNLTHADLSGTNLFMADLREASLLLANLTGANLSRAMLGKANLNSVKLCRASLIETRFHHANLFDANLEGADLREADLYEANLSNINLNKANLYEANLFGANLYGATLIEADLSYAKISHAHLTRADLTKAILRNAILNNSNLEGANLEEANLQNAFLPEANLSHASLRKANLTSAFLYMSCLNEADFSEADLTGCSIYGISAWDVNMTGAIQSNLIISRPSFDRSKKPVITVDNLEVAQFINLLLSNHRIRDVIDTITSKVVLILGRFTPERKVILDAIRDELRKRNYSPVLFDFEKPASRDLTETVNILAHLARFIIVDLTDPSSAPHEVATIIPQTVVPVQPLLLRESLTVDGKVVERHEYAMFEDLRHRYRWVLPTFRYEDTADLLASLGEHIIEPAERKAKELAKR